ncbi:MAG TPA: hypothetical protein VIV60_13825, partial [Polyangiaceae bacterium]
MSDVSSLSWSLSASAVRLEVLSSDVAGPVIATCGLTPGVEATCASFRAAGVSACCCTPRGIGSRVVGIPAIRSVSSDRAADAGADADTKAAGSPSRSFVTGRVATVSDGVVVIAED